MVVLVGYLVATGKLASVAALTGDQWAWVFLTGALLTGYVGTWFAALQRAPASLVTAILVVGAPVTAALQALQTGSIPSLPVLTGQALVLLACGGLVVASVRRWRLAPAVGPERTGGYAAP
jgi:drug/metabolite transporter (DMT)-like permease